MGRQETSGHLRHFQECHSWPSLAAAYSQRQGSLVRLAFRTAIANPEAEVKAVSDPVMDLKFLVYQVKYDSVRIGSLAPSPCRLPWASIAMPTTMGINVFGRIGRLAFRAAIANLRVEVKAGGNPFLDLMGHGLIS